MNSTNKKKKYLRDNDNTLSDMQIWNYTDVVL